MLRVLASASRVNAKAAAAWARPAFSYPLLCPPTSTSSSSAARPSSFLSFAARHLSSSSSSDGPPPSKLAAIPFRVSRDTAAAAYAAHHTAHALLPRRPPSPTRVEAAFQPFWAVALVSGTVVLDGATLGFDRYERVYDPGTKRWRSEVRTVWRRVVIPRRTWPVEAAAADPGMQVPASFRHPAAEAAVLRPGADLAGAGPVSAALCSPLPGGGEGAAAPPVVDPFELPPSAAVAAALAHVTAAQAALAGAALRAEYRADRVGSVDLAVHPASILASPVWAPAWRFEFDHYGTRLSTLVSGLDPARVAGPRVLDELRVAAVAAIAAGAAMLLAGGPPAWFGGGIAAWGLGLAAPAAAAALAAHWAPWAGARLAASEAGASRAAAAAGRAAWDEPYVEGTAEADARARAERARRRERAEEEEEEASGTGPGRSGPPGDPRGFYAALGVPPSATTRDIQAAYRGLALSTHPDRVPEGEKAAATAKFQRINQAYAVLRDPAKRRAYDAGRR